MSLQNLLDLSQNYGNKVGLSEERVQAQLPKLREQIAFFREYPDLFIDFLVQSDPSCNFKFYFYQRVFLRVAMRHRYVYATFPRAFSKSFLTMMVMFIRAILYPNSHLFVTTGGKEQAASITVAKIEEICKLIPALNKELNLERGQTKKSKDDVEYVFKNGSKIDVLAARQSSRGQRRTGGTMEECVLIDGDILNEVIIPTTNVDRLLSCGVRIPEEPVNKSQIYITTAGWKDSFAYKKLVELLVQSIIEPDMVMIMGGTYETPVIEGLLNEDFVDQLKLQGTFNDASFDREYRSVWSGDSENAFFSSEVFDKNRVLLQPEYEYSGRSSKSAYYVLGVDVGRLKCTTEITVVKVTPQVQGAALKTMVNLFTIDAEDFEQQAIRLKKLYYKYKARQLAIDANGLGVGLIDFMTKVQVDPETGDTLPAFGVSGGTSADITDPYKKIKGSDVEEEAMYLIKANAPINTEAHTYVQTQMSSGKIKFLIDEMQAKTKLMSTKVGQAMDSEARAEYLMPFTLTTILREQMLNLREENEGVNIILKQSSKKIPKDKFSSFEYAMYYVKQEEDRSKKKKKRNISDFVFMN